MNPLDFISLAIRLSNSEKEADLRSAVSRAYYGAFHFSRLTLVECGIRFPPKEIYGAEIHTKVRYCFNAAGQQGYVAAARKLRALRNERNEADYSLDSRRFTNAATVAAIVNEARATVDDIQQCGVDPDFIQVRERLRAYARDVLRLPIETDEAGP